MITKAQVKHIRLLDDKKYRTEQHQFVVEGDKMVKELLHSEIETLSLFAYKNWLQENQSLTQSIETFEVEPFELERISSLKTPNKVLAIASIPKPKNRERPALALLLDGIQDPGNFGSIIRIADWYNIKHIFCSESSADVFNSKVIQASMGSVFRINVERCDLKILVEKNPDIPTYAATLHGNDINTFPKLKQGFIIIGNEANGVSEELITIANYQITIPSKGQAESLNAAVATGIICHCMLS